MSVDKSKEKKTWKGWCCFWKKVPCSFHDSKNMAWATTPDGDYWTVKRVEVTYEK